ncbi:hypothetical protein FBD94_05205 [Pedobacter hiemivivus]|jgi:uncharacterized membrane protein|uniref:DUF4870 domain-containing protein n=1 Tax=Pedobacter hiemivivus TaxID=2530454 RepID=A0A4U1GHM4_9SPHI|nr:hypothetical protein [Pedobacter hiemivivus]TKC63747.1 hypothetical protein FBD94_05205 [Pedobacter hiemivivus]
METNKPFNPTPVTSDNGKTAAILSYFGIILWLIAYFALHKDKKTDFGSYHLRQTLLFAIISTVIYFALSFFLGILIATTGMFGIIYLAYIVYVGLFIIWIIGFIGVLNGEKKPMPLIGERAQTMFPEI